MAVGRPGYNNPAGHRTPVSPGAGAVGHRLVSTQFGELLERDLRAKRYQVRLQESQ